VHYRTNETYGTDVRAVAIAATRGVIVVRVLVRLELIVFNRLYKRIRLTVCYELFIIGD